MSAMSEWAAVENGVTGDRMLILHRGPDADGEVLEVQFDLPPHASRSPMHRHSRLTERFEVLDGALRLCVDGRWTTMLPGDAIVVEPGQSHCFLNDSDVWTTFIAEVRPPGQFERFLRSWYGLANAGRATRDGVPRNVFHLARCLHDADFTFAALPSGPQRVVLRILVALGHTVGAYAALMDYDIAPVRSRLAPVS